MITTRGLRKRYRGRVALDGLDLDVPTGATYGFIGQNGTGKTTTIRILATLLLADDGWAEVGGVDVTRRPAEARRLFGYVPDTFGVYDDLTVGEYLELYGSLYGLRGSKLARSRDDLLALVDLGSRRESYVAHLSRGMQQRLGLARALIHEPAVLLLDEPASGLDPIGRLELREILRELAQLGKTILLSSHILSELADLCSHVGILHNGRLVRQGAVGPLLAMVGRPSYRLELLGGQEQAVALLTGQAGIVDVTTAERGIRFWADDAAAAAGALAVIVAAGLPIGRFGPDENSLERTFIEIARGGGSA